MVALGCPLAVESVGQLFFRRVADTCHFAAEMQFLAGQRVVEIHLHAFGLDFYYFAWNHAAGLVHHRDYLTDHTQLFLDLAVDLENMLGQFNDRLGVVTAIALFGAEDEFERVADGFAGQVFFKLGEQVAQPVAEPFSKNSAFKETNGLKESCLLFSP